MSDDKQTREVRKVQVYDASGSVVVENDESRYIFDPGMAVQFANAMLQAAVNCGATVTIEAEKPKFSDLQRTAMIVRVGHVMRSLRGRKPEVVAAHVVDTVLAGVL